MDSWGLVIHDEQSFLSKVVNAGIEAGAFTRDRADEIIRISVAMANKYVLQKEVDFRSADELAKVQETVLKMVGVGLEIKSKSNVEEALRFLMNTSPVDLFRLAYTRIEKLRHSWRQLLLDHRIEILVSSAEFQCLSDLTCQRLAELSVFNESEIYTIRSLTLEDELFSSLAVVEYYEAEIERYQFIRKMKKILPFDLLNRSTKVRGENLSEVDSIRDALINTLIISAHVGGSDPVSVTMAEVRDFLDKVIPGVEGDLFPDELEDVLVDLIHELGENLEEKEASMLARMVIDACRALMETIITELETITANSEGTFFKRWSRLAVLADAPDPLDRILSAEERLDDYDFEILVDHISKRSPGDAAKIAARLPWRFMAPAQIIRLFDQLHEHQEAMGKSAVLTGFTALELVDLFEVVDFRAFKKLIPAIHRTLSESQFSLEDLELIASAAQIDPANLLRSANPPINFDAGTMIREFKDGTEMRRSIIVYSCRRSHFFSELLAEAWAADPGLVKKLVGSLPTADVGEAFWSACGWCKPEQISLDAKHPRVGFESDELNALFKHLPASKKRAVVKFFADLP